MAVAIDNVSTGLQDTGATVLTFSHICAGASRYLVVTVGTNGALPTGVTYAGVAMTQLGTTQESPTGYRISLWGLAQPGTGSNNVVVTRSATSVCAASAISFTGVDQLTPVGVYVGATGTSTAPTVGPITDADAGDMIVDGLCWTSSGGAATATVGALQTQRSNQDATNINSASSTEPGQSSVTMSWTLSASRNWALGAIAVYSEEAAIVPTVARVLVPLGSRNKKGKNYAGLAFAGWQQNASFDIPLTQPTDFFCCNYLG